MLSQRPHFADWDSLRQFGSLSTPIWVFDVDRHGIWWANQAAVTFWEADGVDDLVARDFGTDSQNVRMRLRQMVESGSTMAPVQDTWTLYPKDRPRTVVLTSQPIVVGDGVNALLFEINRILDMNADTEALRMLEAIRTAALMVSTFSADGRLLAQNPEAQAVYGAAWGQYRHLRARIVDPKIMQDLVACVLRNETFDAECDVRATHETRRHRIVARRGRDPVTGEFVVVLTEEDVTEPARLRQQMQDLNAELEAKVAERTSRLQQSEERYELATRAAAIWDWQAETGELFVSPRFAETLGYDAETFRALLSSQLEDNFILPEDVAEFREAVRTHLKTPGRPWEYEGRVVGQTGDIHWFNLRGFGVPGPDGRTVRSVGLMTDVTNRKELEATLFAAQRMEAVGRLTGGVAHDFNNLLTVIGGNAELLELSERVDPDLTAAIVQAVKRGAQLTRHLLAYSRKQPLSPRVVDVAGMMDELHRNLLRLLDDSITVEMRIAPDLWTVYADPGQIESAVLNIALNARDAMPDGGTLTVSCDNLPVIGAAPPGMDLAPGDYVEFRVVDTGTGMAKSTLDRAFEPFFTTKEVGKGSGLGLSMVFGFSRQSGGDVRIDSQLGQGTTVSMCLPRAVQPGTRSPELSRASVAGGGERILLLEDDAAVQATLERILDSLNYRVDCAATLTEARAQLTKGPALCLLDVVLRGGESGLDFAEHIRAARPDLPIVMMSGYPDTEEDSWALRYDGFLQKPVHAPKLSQMLGALLNR